MITSWMVSFLDSPIFLYSSSSPFSYFFFYILAVALFLADQWYTVQDILRTSNPTREGLAKVIFHFLEWFRFFMKLLRHFCTLNSIYLEGCFFAKSLKTEIWQESFLRGLVKDLQMFSSTPTMILCIYIFKMCFGVCVNV